MKTKKIITTALIIIGALFIFNDSSFAQTYVPLERIPGTTIDNQDTFPEYIQAIYKFAVWTVGIAALFMISIGGFMYFTAAGNTSRIETAKKVISDALFGLVAVLVAWLILNTINPDLVKINLDSLNNLR